MSFPITKYPLSLSHSDGTPSICQKSVLLHKLESFQESPPNVPVEEFEVVIDGGLLVHSVLSQTNSGSSIQLIASKMLSAIFKTNARTVHFRQSGKKLLQSTNFKNELILFLIISRLPPIVPCPAVVCCVTKLIWSPKQKSNFSWP